MKTLLTLPLLCASLAAQNAVAHVNDTVSPGRLGDTKLSLDEAVRVLNLKLSMSMLSSAERAQITGMGTPRAIRIDAKVTPTITLQQNLTPLDGPAAHLDFELEGENGTPVLDATGRDWALRIRTNHAHVHRLAIKNGKAGVIADTSVHFHHGEPLELEELELSGQTEVGILLQASGSKATTPALVKKVEFESLATAIRIDDRSSNAGAVMLTGELLDFEKVDLGFDVFIASSGTTTMCRIYRAKMRDSDQLLRERRTTTSNQRAMLMFIGGDFETNGDMVDIQGNTLIETAFHFHHSRFKPAAGKKAMRLWPQEGRFDWHGSENVVHGDMDVLAGRLNRRLWAWNNVFRNGTLTMSNEGARPSMKWNKFESYNVMAPANNRSRIELSSSEFRNCKLDAKSAFGNIVLDNCWLVGTTTTGQVSVRNRAPSPWLGESSISTDTPKLGATVDLTLDLPAGMVGIWHLGIADKTLRLTEEPWRFYAFRDRLVRVPGAYILHSTVRLPIPNDPVLSGLQLYALPVSVPYFGQRHVPEFNLPAGAYMTPTATAK